MSWVIDASSVVDLLESSTVADRTIEIVGGGPLHAPDLISAEVVSALARRARAGAGGVDDALRLFAQMPITRHPSHQFLPEVWNLRENVRVTDGFYVALASSLDVPLVTSDGRLGRAIEQRSLCDVRIVA